jgi:hypothetical protein
MAAIWRVSTRQLYSQVYLSRVDIRGEEAAERNTLVWEKILYLHRGRIFE